MPSYVHICDAEFLSARRGTRTPGTHGRGLEQATLWPSDAGCGARAAHLIVSLRQSPKKVAGWTWTTLCGAAWGRPTDWMDIEMRHIARGEASRLSTLPALADRRGILLAVCSKNDYEKAVGLRKHPEMVLRMRTWVLQATGSRIGEHPADRSRFDRLDSFCSFDDNPAEIEIVASFCRSGNGSAKRNHPSMPDAAGCAILRPKSLTAEDGARGTV